MASRYPNCDPEMEWDSQSDSDSQKASSDNGKQHFNILSISHFGGEPLQNIVLLVEEDIPGTTLP